MKFVTGVDLVYLPKFKKALKNGGEVFLRRVFRANELAGPVSVNHLAGIFAAKEAVIKALGLPVDSWHDIKVTHLLNGRPNLKIASVQLADQISNSSLSISHDGSYVIAQFVAILR